jgi:hypothetical protein
MSPTCQTTQLGEAGPSACQGRRGNQRRAPRVAVERLIQPNWHAGENGHRAEESMSPACRTAQLGGAGPLACQGRTGKRPQFSRGNQSRCNGVGFNVVPDLHKLALISYVVVERLILPKRVAGAVQESIGSASRGAFQPPRQNGYRHERQNQNVNVIGHDNPGIEFIESSAGIPVANRVHNSLCNRRVPQTSGAAASACQRPILRYKRVSGARIALGLLRSWQRAIKSPRKEHISRFVVEVRQSSFVFGHNYLAGRRACPTQHCGLGEPDFSCA